MYVDFIDIAKYFRTEQDTTFLDDDYSASRNDENSVELIIAAETAQQSKNSGSGIKRKCNMHKREITPEFVPKYGVIEIDGIAICVCCNKELPNSSMCHLQ